MPIHHQVLQAGRFGLRFICMMTPLIIIDCITCYPAYRLCSTSFEPPHRGIPIPRGTTCPMCERFQANMATV